VDVNLNIEDKELEFIKEYLKGKTHPLDLSDVANRIALFKTRDTRTHRVKLYNPNCEYKIGDLIFKEYPGKIPIGSKKFIELEGGVILKVVGVKFRFGINEIQLKYEGTSDFKKYTGYLDRQKIELLLPHKQAKPCEKPEYMSEEIDPRKQLDPLEKRDFTSLTRKLSVVLNKDSEIALISNKILLKENLKPIDNTAFEKIKEFLKENKKSETTEFFVENFVKIRPDHEDFDSYCFSLNHRMQIDYKIDFQQTHGAGWGKWNLISVIYYMRKNSLISEENPLLDKVTIANRKNIVQRRKKFEESMSQDGCTTTRYYLTQREISAGAIRLNPGFFDMGDSIEIDLVDTKQKKSYVAYYYKDVNILLGLKEVFERYRTLQATIFLFETPEETTDFAPTSGKLVFNIRTTKKGTVVDRIEYDPDKKAFNVSDEKIASPAFVNKAMFLDSTVIRALYERIDEFREVETLNELIHKIFLEFGTKERNYEIHILRLYHILDLVYPIDLKLVEEVILGNDEFVPAEKMAGVFYLDSDAVVGIEEEEVKRKESLLDETRKKREEVKKEKIEQERRIKEEIRRKREDRRRKREQEMWEKERLRKEIDDKRTLEIKRKKEADLQAQAKTPPAPRPAKPSYEKERTEERPTPQFTPKPAEKTTGKPTDKQPEIPMTKPTEPPSFQPTERPAAKPTERPTIKPLEKFTEKPITKKYEPMTGEKTEKKTEFKKREIPFKPAAEFEKAPEGMSAEEFLRKKEASRWDKKHKDEEKPISKPFKKVERTEEEEVLSEDEIKSQIELEKLKEQMRDRQSNLKENQKKEKVAYKDNGGFSGILASKLDQVVKKGEDKKDETPGDKEKNKQ